MFTESNNSVIKGLLMRAAEYKPDGIFSICNIPGWFFIIGDNILYFEVLNLEDVINSGDDALEILKQTFTQMDFLPVFSGQKK